jgi:2-hydroxychromene-2-carboxylate isomerase
LVAEDRTEHQWRRVRFAYMDVRRYANLRGLTVRAPQKIWDSSLANIALLWAKAQGREKMLAYNDITFERFWKRELDIEDAAAVSAVLAEANCDTAGFNAFFEGEGRLQHDRIRAQAEDDMGIFGVPTFVVDGEIFWGREHLPLVRARLKGEIPTGDPASVL